MENWKIHLVTFCALVQLSQGRSHSAEEMGISDNWLNESVDRGLTNPVESLMKRSKALQFYGLMGKRTVTKKPFQVDRRNKGEVFVGLMGRSLSSGESLTGASPPTTSHIHVPEKPYKQGLPEEWIQILY